MWSSDHWEYEDFDFLRKRVIVRGYPTEVHRRVGNDWIFVPPEEFRRLVKSGS